MSVIAQKLVHRGPDGRAVWISADQSAGLVHTRLAIIDPTAAADQPMHSANGSHTIVFNGEIFNFIELKEELEREGSVFRTRSDTEVLLEAWRRWQWEMLPKLNGMWAFAIRDNRSGRLYLARDRFGVKPLLYVCGEQGFAFASETQALLELPMTGKEIDVATARATLFDPFSIEGSERTLFAAIRRLPPGHYAEYVDGSLSIRRWWRTIDNLEEPPRSLEDAGERFRALFFDSIRIRMRSDVPLGTCLSGGFDSTAVVSGMNRVAADFATNDTRESRDWRHAFVASFPGLGHDETPEAKLAAGYAGIEPKLFDFSDDDGRENLDTVLSALDDIHISAPTAIWKIYRSVRQSSIVVTLDGHGADEMFGGYRAVGQGIGFTIRNWLGNGAGRSRSASVAAAIAKLNYIKAKHLYFLRGGTLLPPPSPSIAAMQDELPRHWSLFDRRLYGMFHATVLPTLLRNYDRLSMTHGVEIRMPFMDWRLVSFVMSLPEEMKSANGFTKLVARVGMKGYMPENIRTSPRKIGFNSQMPDWMNGSLGEWAVDLLGTPNPLFNEIVDTVKLCQAIARLNATKAWTWQSSDRIWPYVNLKWYLDRHAA